MTRIIIFLFTALLAGAAEQLSPKDLYNKPYSAFQSYGPAQKVVPVGEFDTNLLAAAVFHETNRRRELQGLPALSFNPGAQEAAAMQARIMAKKGKISHDNPEHPELKTLQDRVRKAGLTPQFAAENVATAFDIQYESGRTFYERVENGRTIASYTPKGKSIPRHTYLSFAKQLLDGWMNSPGHRKNILHKSAKSLGASCVPGVESGSGPMRTFYCAQVFYTPLE